MFIKMETAKCNQGMNHVLQQLVSALERVKSLINYNSSESNYLKVILLRGQQ